MITVENLTKKFGEVTAVEGLNFRVEEGRSLVFLVRTAQAKNNDRQNALLA